MSRPVKISLVSFRTLPAESPGRHAKTLMRMAGHVDEAACRDSALVAFPETCPYLASGETWAATEPLDGPTLTTMRAKAAEHGIYVVC